MPMTLHRTTYEGKGWRTYFWLFYFQIIYRLFGNITLVADRVTFTNFHITQKWWNFELAKFILLKSKLGENNNFDESSLDFRQELIRQDLRCQQ